MSKRKESVKKSSRKTKRRRRDVTTPENADLGYNNNNNNNDDDDNSDNNGGHPEYDSDESDNKEDGKKGQDDGGDDNIKNSNNEDCDDYIKIGDNDDNPIMDFLLRDQLDRDLLCDLRKMLNRMANLSVEKSKSAFEVDVYIPDEMVSKIFIHLEKVEEILNAKRVCRKWYYIIVLSPNDSIPIWRHYEKKYKSISSFPSLLHFGQSGSEGKERKKKEKKEKNKLVNVHDDQDDDDDDDDSGGNDEEGKHGMDSLESKVKTVADLSSHLLAIIYRVRRYYRNSYSMCSECGLSFCSPLCALCTSASDYLNNRRNLWTVADEETYPSILKDGFATAYPTYFSFSSVHIIRHCSACHKIATESTFDNFRVVRTVSLFSNISFETLVMCPECLDFFSRYQKDDLFHRDEYLAKERNHWTLQIKSGNQCRDLILCKACSKDFYSDFAGMKYPPPCSNKIDRDEDDNIIWNECDGVWMGEYELRSVFTFVSECYWKEIKKACIHRPVYYLTSDSKLKKTRKEEEEEKKRHPPYLIEVYDLENKKFVLYPWDNRLTRVEEYCKKKFSKTNLYLVSDVIFFYYLYKMVESEEKRRHVSYN